MKEESWPVITIDGPAGTGKTSVARALAAKLGWPCLDTGAMFRFAALNFGPGALDMGDLLLQRLRTLSFSLEGAGENTRLSCNGKAAGPELRDENIGKLASQLAAIPLVREAMLEAQRRLGMQGPLVAEGRDMGTVVFPHAPLKIFLDAKPAVRAQRRFLQLAEAGTHANIEELEKSIAERDERDRNRPIAPLKAAPDAIVIDTDNISLEEVLARIHALAAQKREELKLPANLAL